MSFRHLPCLCNFICPRCGLLLLMIYMYIYGVYCNIYHVDFSHFNCSEVFHFMNILRFRLYCCKTIGLFPITTNNAAINIHVRVSLGICERESLGGE